MKSPSFKRKLLWCLFIGLVLFGLARLYYVLTDDFRLSNIAQEMPYQQAWELPAMTPSEEAFVQKLLSQKYYYIGKGAQSYAFASEDDRYVLKFFKFKHLRPSWFQEMLPSIGPLKDYKEKQTARKQRKLYGVFDGYKLAYDVDKEASGLHFVQLNVENNPQRTITVTDKIGLERTVELASVPFVLQDKGRTLRDVIRKLLVRGDVVIAQKRFNQILDMYASEYAKGIFDHDHGVMCNTGFVGDRPLHLDVGKLMRNMGMLQKDVARHDMMLVIASMEEWVKKNFPDNFQAISDSLRQKVNELYDNVNV